ncbi:unnamed protein product [Owenia fusiformis]|uniref:Uncharacterized protein n=1 Tax=Owenia fusiformis TaxID=6347 RepID=A0A8J1T4K7_OWEFU|nr:unnamed protein product [Owenia fusiformis]
MPTVSVSVIPVPESGVPRADRPLATVSDVHGPRNNIIMKPTGRRPSILSQSLNHTVSMTSHFTKPLQSKHDAPTSIDSMGYETQRDSKMYVPRMNKSLAIICFCLNIAAPGTGTMLSGVMVPFCLTRTDDMTCVEIVKSSCLCMFLGLLQLVTVPFFLFGWIWSIMWGVSFVGASASYEIYGAGIETRKHNQVQMENHIDKNHKLIKTP